MLGEAGGGMVGVRDPGRREPGVGWGKGAWGGEQGGRDLACRPFCFLSWAVTLSHQESQLP